MLRDAEELYARVREIQERPLWRYLWPPRDAFTVLVYCMLVVGVAVAIARAL